MMHHPNLTLFIQHSPLTGSQQQEALSFLKDWLSAGKSVTRVFFYQDAVLTAHTDLTQAPENVADEFIALAKTHQFPLQVCIASATRRGVLDESEAKKQQTQATLNPAFNLVGLGELAQAASNHDNMVSF